MGVKAIKWGIMINIVRKLVLCALIVPGVAGCALTGQADKPNGPAMLAMKNLPAMEPVSRGKMHFAAGRYGLAESNFRKAVELDPNNLEAWVGLAASYDRMRRFDLASRAYRSAIKIGGETPAVLNNLGYSYLLRGNTRMARKKLLKAQRLDPDNPSIKANLALLEKGRRMKGRGA